MGRYSFQRCPTSSLYDEALLPKKVSHAVAQIPLQFDAVLDRGAAGAARSLQVVSELLQERGVAWKAVDDRDRLAAASFFSIRSFATRRAGSASSGPMRLLHLQSRSGQPQP